MSTPREAQPPKPPRRRIRRWVRIGAVATALLSLLAGALLYWLLATTGGRDTLLFRIVGLLPPGTLSWDSVDGVMQGPLVLHGLRYRDGDIEFRARRVLLDPDLLPVLGNRLQLDRLEVDDAQLSLPAAADEPFALPEWPGSLPRLPMPLDLRASVLQLRGLRIVRGGEPLVELARADGVGLQFVHDGVHVDELHVSGDFGKAVLRGEYLPARDYRSELSAFVMRPARDDAPAVTLQLTARGDLTDLAVVLTGNAPGPLSATFAVKGDDDNPSWRLQARADALDPTLFGAAAGEPWHGTLAAHGQGGNADLEGELRVAGIDVGIAPSKLSLVDGELRAEPLQLKLAQGPLRIVGTLQVDDEDVPQFDVVATSDALRLAPAGAGAVPVDGRGELHAKGSFAKWSLVADATLKRAGAQAQLQVRGDGDREALHVRTLAVHTPDGDLDGEGLLRWQPLPAFELEARLAGFDPAYFLPDYPGAVAGTLVVTGERGDDGAWRGQGRAEGLSGQLRGRGLSGRAQADWNGRRGEADVDIGVGDSRLRVVGGFGDQLDLQAQFAPLQLADLFAGGAGRIDGTLGLRGPAGQVDIEADLSGSDLRWQGDRAATLRVLGRLPARAGSGSLAADATDLVIADVALQRLSVQATGHQADLQVRAEAGGADGELALAAMLARDGGAWRGRVDSFQLAPARGPRLELVDAVAFRYGVDTLQFGRACLRAVDAGGQLCAAADGREIVVDGDALPLSLLQPWLALDDALPLQAFGVVAVDGRFVHAAGGWQGKGALRSVEGGLRLAEELDHDVFAYRDLLVQLDLAGASIDARIDAALADGGSIAASLRGGRDEKAPMNGELRLDVRDLTWLELFSEDIAAPKGRLTGTLAIAGTRAAPALSGTAGLAGFAAELPALGLKLSKGDFDLVGTNDGSVRVQGQVASGDGTLRLDGSVNFRDDHVPVVLSLSGDDVTLASTAELYLVADPELTLRWLEEALEVRGTLAVSKARLDLESLDSSVEISPDVVVVDADEPTTARAKPLDLDFSVQLGDDVKLEGFGLDGTMTGAVKLRQHPGRRATATGTLEVAGKYRAYGRLLTIQRARLGYADSPFDNPTLDIRAERKFEQATVGVQVRGTARRPETTVVSSPAMETSEALSWLVFGRPLNTTTSGENKQLGAAAVALGAGGGLVAQQLGASLGLDEVGVVDSRNLGGATFTIGKYVSPRLFLSYGVSLVGTGQVVTLKYLLAHGFDISVESGNENAASLNWRREK